MRKLRILFSGEASFLSTGFSVYNHELLTRLRATGKYELGEFATYGEPARFEPRARNLPWAYFPCAPDQDNPEQIAQYQSNVKNQFGQWRFEEVCLAFQPDVVVDVRDHWMLDYQETSPFRPYYTWGIMPTVDAQPQAEPWLATYMNADAVFTYSDWGLELLRKQSRGRMNLKCSAPPGANLQEMQPVGDKRGHKAAHGLSPDALVVGTVMRNQRRKLYPDLIKAFGVFLAEAPKSVTDRAYLYLHTAYPDVGWNIPQLVKESGFSHRILFTYSCKACGSSFPSYYQDAKAVCKSCGNLSASMPTSDRGVSRKVLCEVMNLFDCYVQYASNEGFGMPQVEAAACGVPVFAVDYSAMSDVVRKLKGYPVPVKCLVREPETMCYRAQPDNEAFAAELAEFLRLPEPVRAREGRNARKAVEEHYTYDRTAKIWEDYLDSVEVPDQATTWGSPRKTFEPATSMPANLSDEEFVRWGIGHLAGRPELAHSHLALRILRDLLWGLGTGVVTKASFNEMSTLGVNIRPNVYTRADAANEMVDMARRRNYWEERRTS